MTNATDRRFVQTLSRRSFIAGCAGAAIATVHANAQSQRKLKVGFIRGASYPAWGEAFVARLAELGYSDEKTIELRIHETDERPSGLQAVIQKLVADKVDVLVTTGTTATIMAKKATSQIPIVFLSVSDPVRASIVSNLARPEANITGISNTQGDAIGKRVDLLREIVPKLESLGVLSNANNPAGVAEQVALIELCKGLGIEAVGETVTTGGQLSEAFQKFEDKIQALYVFGDYLTVSHRKRINELALRHRIPTIYPFKEFVWDGGLISYGPNVSLVFQRAAEYVARILAGARPSDLPVEQPTRFEMTANARTARILSVSFSNSIMVSVDSIVE